MTIGARSSVGSAKHAEAHPAWGHRKVWAMTRYDGHVVSPAATLPRSGPRDSAAVRVSRATMPPSVRSRDHAGVVGAGSGTGGVLLSPGPFEDLEVICVEAGMSTTRFCRLVDMPERTWRR
jgi:hypothetical protein